MTDIPSRLATALSDRYRIERELGAGGMATVYLAEDLKHERRVALKVLRPELAAVIGAERFLADLSAAVNFTRENPDVSGGMAPVYGLAATLPVRSVVGDLLERYMDTLYKA